MPSGPSPVVETLLVWNDAIPDGVALTGEHVQADCEANAHLHACILGRSESAPIIDGKLQLGQLAQTYFADLDGVRVRDRVARFQIVGD